MKWISIEDKLPEECESVLIYRAEDQTLSCIEQGYYVPPGYHYDEDGNEMKDGEIVFKSYWVTSLQLEYESWNDLSELFSGRKRELLSVTHWMPLPPGVTT